MEPSRSGTGLDALERAGVVFEGDAATLEIAEGGYVRGFFGRIPVDAFFDSKKSSFSTARSSAARMRAGRPSSGRTVECMGEDDVRVREWDRIVDEVG